MKKFIHKTTGSCFWVADERVEEYKAAGHKLAAISLAAQEPKNVVPVKEAEEVKEVDEETEEEADNAKPIKKVGRRNTKKK